jgi:tetratricopeptide (TPR) repeat protein
MPKARKNLKMKKLLLIIIPSLFICGCLSTHNNTEKNNLSSPVVTNISDNSPQPEEGIDTAYLNNQILTQKEFIKRLDKIDKKYQDEGNRLWKILIFLGTLFSILTFFGGRKYLAINERLSETLNLYEIMEKGIDEKEKELRQRFSDEIGKKKDEYSSIDQANYLDYEHRLYFAHIYLPLTKKTKDYKESLYMLGQYWLEQGKCGRALLRFREIERIQRELDAKNNYLFRILMASGKNNIIEERILGKDTSRFFNSYGYALSACSEEPNVTEKFKAKLLEEATVYYKKAISVDQNYSSPHYNLGRLYGYSLRKDEEALVHYKEVFGKIPDISYKTYRNMVCSMIRLNKQVELIIKTLNKIPKGIPYWQEIVKDEFISEKIKTTPKLRSFIIQRSGIAAI